MIENENKLPKKQWKRWTNHQRRVFNYVFAAMRDQRVYLHPETALVPEKHWRTTRWNAAWMAADGAGA